MPALDTTTQPGLLWTVAPALLPVRGERRAYPVRRIYCVGRNYVEHIREMREADERDPPFFFQKPPDAIVAPGAAVPYPPATGDLQHEVELVAAIGRAGREIDAAQALSHVYGYAVGVDMTRRDRQKECRERMLPWEAGKSFDHSAPCGEIVPAARIGHPCAGELSLSVNGARRQHGDLRQMIWNVPEIVAQLSRQYTLMPGDLVYTGTPAGVGPVQRGDRIDAAIAGVGELAFTIA